MSLKTWIVALALGLAGTVGVLPTAEAAVHGAKAGKASQVSHKAATSTAKKTVKKKATKKTTGAKKAKKKGSKKRVH